MEVYGYYMGTSLYGGKWCRTLKAEATLTSKEDNIANGVELEPLNAILMDLDP